MPTSWVQQTAQRCADLEPRLGEQRGSGPGRATTLVAGVRVVANPDVDEPWATSAFLMSGYPGAATLDDVLRWLLRHGAGPCSVVTRTEHADDPGWADHGLTRWEDQPVFAATAAHATTLDAAPASALPPDVEVAGAGSDAEFWEGYGCWLGGLDAASIVPRAFLARPDAAFLVARYRAQAVGSAIVRWADRSGYLGGIGVRADLRGRGIGTALTAVATSVAASGPNRDGADPDGRPIDLVWMHASADGAPLYARLGFTQVDTHVILAHA